MLLRLLGGRATNLNSALAILAMVGKLIYSGIASLDGYVEDREGKFDWAKPDEEVHAFINDLERSLGTYLYGRRLYETMVVWETLDTGPEQDPVLRDYAELWRAAEKVVYSRTLDRVHSQRTRIEQVFEPAEVRRLKAARERDLGIGGAELAGEAIAAGLVDEIRLVLVPVVAGGGTPALPREVPLGLELRDLRRFASGAVHLRYRVRAQRSTD
jgi:dihydrofolate reductase